MLLRTCVEQQIGIYKRPSKGSVKYKRMLKVNCVGKTTNEETLDRKEELMCMYNIINILRNILEEKSGKKIYFFQFEIGINQFQ